MLRLPRWSCCSSAVHDTRGPRASPAPTTGSLGISLHPGGGMCCPREVRPRAPPFTGTSIIHRDIDPPASSTRSGPISELAHTPPGSRMNVCRSMDVCRSWMVSVETETSPPSVGVGNRSVPTQLQPVSRGLSEREGRVNDSIAEVPQGKDSTTTAWALRGCPAGSGTTCRGPIEHGRLRPWR